MENETPETSRAVERIRQLVEEVIAGTPLFVVDVDVRGRKGSQAVDIFIDSDEGLDVAKLTEVSREVGFLLDMEDVIPGKYNLNVSSPGLDRPLALPRQYRKNLNRTLRVHYRKEDGSGNAEAVGTLVDVSDEAVEIAPDSGPRQRIGFDQILWAKVQLPW